MKILLILACFVFTGCEFMDDTSEEERRQQYQQCINTALTDRTMCFERIQEFYRACIALDVDIDCYHDRQEYKQQCEQWHDEAVLVCADILVPEVLPALDLNPNDEVGDGGVFVNEAGVIILE